MHHPSDYRRKRRCDPGKSGQTENDESTEDHVNQAPHGCDSRKTFATQSTSQGPMALCQRSAYSSSDDKHDDDAEVRDVESERRAPHQDAHREQDGNRRPSSIQLPEYRDDRDSAIVHFGVIGTHEGKTFIPKRSVHRNALDDLACPYDEGQDFFMLAENLDGDQIEHLLDYSEIYYAGGLYTDILQMLQIAYFYPSVDQRNAYQNSTTS